MPGQQSLYNTAHACLLTPYGLMTVSWTMFCPDNDASGGLADLHFQYRAEGWSLEEGSSNPGSFNIDQGRASAVVICRENRLCLFHDISLPVCLSGGASHPCDCAPRRRRAWGVLNALRPGYLPNDPIASLADADKVVFAGTPGEIARKSG